MIYDPNFKSFCFMKMLSRHFCSPGELLPFNRHSEKKYLHSMSLILKQFVKWQIYHEIVFVTFIAISLSQFSHDVHPYMQIVIINVLIIKDFKDREIKKADLNLFVQNLNQSLSSNGVLPSKLGTQTAISSKTMFLLLQDFTHHTCCLVW